MADILALPHLADDAIFAGERLVDNVAVAAKGGAGVLSKLGRVATIGGKGVPLLGAAFNGGSSYFANERAELAADTGLISQDAVNPIRAALAGYTATGLGGVFAMAATETGGALAFDTLLDQFDVDPVMGRMIRPEFVSDMAMDPSLNAEEWAAVEKKYAPDQMAKTYADIQTRFELPATVNLGQGRMISMADAIRNDEIFEKMEDHYDDAENEKALRGLEAMRMAASAEATAQHWLTTFRPEQDPKGVELSAAATTEAAREAEAAQILATERATRNTQATQPAPQATAPQNTQPNTPQTSFAQAAQTPAPQTGQHATTPGTGANMANGFMDMLERNGAWALIPAVLALGTMSNFSQGRGMGGMMQVAVTTLIVGAMIWGAEKMGLSAPGISTGGLRDTFGLSASGQSATPQSAVTAQTPDTEQDVARRTGIHLGYNAPAPG
ncbi:hypothetical protein [Micavibrio aeruginosavorus]|uniref:hypothetical protein n=1 Tax=Micavibrio aeruginosavorus TaxID=349221 RepID=UPI003F4ABEE9